MISARAIAEMNTVGNDLISSEPSPVFQAAEHALDPVAFIVGPLVIFDRLFAELSPFDSGVFRYLPGHNVTSPRRT